MSLIYPPPWHLQGTGYILLYRFSAEFIQTYGFIPPNEQITNLLGAVMVVRYTETAVGPYDELLFVPGFMKDGATHYPSITKIYVSTQESITGGQENWAIPKQLGHFTWHQDGRDETLVVTHEGQPVIEWTLRQPRLTMPTYISLLPARFRTVMQRQAGKTYYTTLTGKGRKGISQLHSASSNTTLFPPVHLLKPLMVVKVTRFQMTFPIPCIKDSS